jgi:streptogramin lyase
MVAVESAGVAEEIHPSAPAPEGSRAYRLVQVVWNGGEDRWRVDIVEEDPPALRGGPGSFSVSEGRKLGEYRAVDNEFSLDSDAPQRRLPSAIMGPALGRIRELQLGLEEEGDRPSGFLEDYFRDNCRVRPDERIAGRLARHVSCPETADPRSGVNPAFDSFDIWFDAEYGLVLKFEGGRGFRSEVRTLELNPTFPEGLFEVVPPPGAKVVSSGGGLLPPEFRVRPDPEVSATIPVASFLGMVEVGFGSVWVASGADFTVRRIDPATGEILAAIRVGTLDRLVVGEGAVWMAQCRIDPATNDFGGQLEGLGPTGGDEDCRPRTEEVSEEGELEERSAAARNRYVIAAGGGAVWAIGPSDPSAQGGDSLYRIDPRTGEVIASVPLGAGLAGWAAALGDDALWLASSELYRGPARLVRIDTRTNQIAATIELDRPSRYLAVGEGAVWVTTPVEWDGPGSLVRIDPATNRVVATIDLGRGAGAVAVGGGFVWVANRSHDTVTKIDPKSNKVVGKPIVVGGEPGDVAVGLGALWIANFADGTLARIDL